MILMYEAEVVDLAPDSALPGYINVRIPELFGPDTMPTPVGPLFSGSVGGWHCTPTLRTPEGETTRVIVIKVAPYVYKYVGTTQGWETVNDSQGTACGVRSGNGRHRILLKDDTGLQMVVSPSDDGVTTKNYVSVGTDGTISLGTQSGSTVAISEVTISVLNAAGDALLLDSDDGIILVHHDGVSVVSLTEDEIKMLSKSVQVNANTVNIVGRSGIVLTDDLTGLTPTESLLLGNTFLIDLSKALTELAAIVALGFPTTNTLAMIVSIASSLGAGAPYLSTVSKTS